MSEVRSELKYLSSHEWARVEADGTVTIGITDHAQDSLGDVVYVETPEVGSTVTAGEEAGVVESVKAASDIYSLISGEVIAINEALEETPEIVNESPYDDGWFFKVKPSDLTDLDSALDADGYTAVCEDD
ncbi:glycine cleavage system protein GcvH [Pseudomaricurvus sp.]|uniref:glycine cleavage system protein GcvH n=1 Tax=Pseudomaricurvus sp. TaxID=2004510 RepID=UPI003F6B39A0